MMLPVSTSTEREWLTRAACKGLTHLFFPRNNFEDSRGENGKWSRIRTARDICNGCPVLADCREWIIEYEDVTSSEPFGFCGGLTESDRKRIIRKRRSDG